MSTNRKRVKVFHRFSLRLKLLLMVLPVLLGFVSAAIFVLNDYYKQSVVMAGIATFADSFDDLGNLIHNCQLERGYSSQFLSGKLSTDELRKQRQIVDKLVNEVHNMYKDLELTEGQRKTLDNELNGILEIRAKVDAKTSASEVGSDYSVYIGGLINAENQLISTYPGTIFTDRLIALVIGELGKESLGRTRAGFAGVFIKDSAIDSELLAKYEEIRGGIFGNGRSVVLSALPQLQTKFLEIFRSDRWKRLEMDMGQVAVLASKGNYGVDGQKFFGEMSTIIEDVNLTLRSESKRLLDEAQSNQKEARASYLFIGAFLIFSVISLSVYGFLTAKGIVKSLEGVGSVLTEGASQIGQATEDIAAVSSDLSSSATEQAAALHETMASIQYIGSLITRTSDNAKLSEKVAIQGSDGAYKGQQAVSQMIESIGEISKANTEIANQIESSNHQLSEIVRLIEEIGNKTKVINDIVFQTKLLSFNASIEAARAGEYGKGFAVVAEEVGNLAQMSGAAAKEISQMLEGSISRVETIVTESKGRVEHLVIEGKSKIAEGTAVAKLCGDSLAGIVINVTDLKRLVSEISVASQEQNLGMGEISKAVAQLEIVTQQNTTAATNSESANQALNSQTISLKEMVSELGSIINGHKNRYGPGGHISFEASVTEFDPGLRNSSKSSPDKKSA